MGSLQIPSVLVRDSCLILPEISEQQQQHQHQQEKKKKIVLSALAHMMWFVPYRTRVLFFEQPPLSSFKAIVAALKQALAKALTEFYPVAGRLSVREDGVMELDCNNEGVLFIEAVLTDGRLEDYQTEHGNFELPHQLLVDLTQNCGHVLEWPWRPDSPLLIVQVSRFTCGGMSISLMFNHQVLDGTAIWSFFKSWAELCRGEKLSFSPEFSVDIPVNLLLQQQQLSHLPPDLFRYRKSDVLPGGELYDSVACLQCDAFIFKKRMLSGLKQEAPGFSTFQLLTGHLWKKITSARQLDDDETTRVVFAINCRERLAGLPANFCGQAAMLIGAGLSVAELQSRSEPANGAAVLKKRIAEFSNDEASSYIELLGSYGSDPEFVVGPRRDPARDIIVKGSFHFPVYQDLGFGKAVGMCVNPVLEDGKIYYFPGQQQGDVIAYITLHSSVMKRLKADPTVLHS